MKNYTQRDLLSEGVIDRVARIARGTSKVGSFINRNVVKRISPTAANVFSKIPTATGLMPRQASETAIKNLTKTKQINVSRFIKEMTLPEVNSETATPTPRRGINLNVSDNQSKYFKYRVELANGTEQNIAIKVNKQEGKGWVASSVIELK